MPKIKWPQFNREIEVRAGTTILDAALDNDIPLEHACGGFCACTTCHVHIRQGVDNLSAMEEMERERLEDNEARTEVSRLGCQTQVMGDIIVEIPSQS